MNNLYGSFIFALERTYGHVDDLELVIVGKRDTCDGLVIVELR